MLLVFKTLGLFILTLNLYETLGTSPDTQDSATTEFPTDNPVILINAKSLNGNIDISSMEILPKPSNVSRFIDTTINGVNSEKQVNNAVSRDAVLDTKEVDDVTKNKQSLSEAATLDEFGLRAENADGEQLGDLVEITASGKSERQADLIRDLEERERDAEDKMVREKGNIGVSAADVSKFLNHNSLKEVNGHLSETEPNLFISDSTKSKHTIPPNLDSLEADHLLDLSSFLKLDPVIKDDTDISFREMNDEPIDMQSIFDEINLEDLGNLEESDIKHAPSTTGGTNQLRPKITTESSIKHELTTATVISVVEDGTTVIYSPTKAESVELMRNVGTKSSGSSSNTLNRNESNTNLETGLDSEYNNSVNHPDVKKFSMDDIIRNAYLNQEVAKQHVESVNYENKVKDTTPAFPELSSKGSNSNKNIGETPFEVTTTDRTKFNTNLEAALNSEFNNYSVSHPDFKKVSMGDVLKTAYLDHQELVKQQEENGSYASEVMKTTSAFPEISSKGSNTDDSSGETSENISDIPFEITTTNIIKFNTNLETALDVDYNNSVNHPDLKRVSMDDVIKNADLDEHLLGKQQGENGSYENNAMETTTVFSKTSSIPSNNNGSSSGAPENDSEHGFKTTTTDINKVNPYLETTLYTGYNNSLRHPNFKKVSMADVDQELAKYEEEKSEVLGTTTAIPESSSKTSNSNEAALNIEFINSASHPVLKKVSMDDVIRNDNLDLELAKQQEEKASYENKVMETTTALPESMSNTSNNNEVPFEITTTDRIKSNNNLEIALDVHYNISVNYPHLKRVSMDDVIKNADLDEQLLGKQQKENGSYENKAMETTTLFSKTSSIPTNNNGSSSGAPENDSEYAFETTTTDRSKVNPMLETALYTGYNNSVRHPNFKKVSMADVDQELAKYQEVQSETIGTTAFPESSSKTSNINEAALNIEFNNSVSHPVLKKVSMADVIRNDNLELAKEQEEKASYDNKVTETTTALIKSMSDTSNNNEVPFEITTTVIIKSNTNLETALDIDYNNSVNRPDLKEVSMDDVIRNTDLDYQLGNQQEKNGSYENKAMKTTTILSKSSSTPSNNNGSSDGASENSSEYTFEITTTDISEFNNNIEAALDVDYNYSVNHPDLKKVSMDEVIKNVYLNQQLAKEQKENASYENKVMESITAPPEPELATTSYNTKDSETSKNIEAAIDVVGSTILPSQITESQNDKTTNSHVANNIDKSTIDTTPGILRNEVKVVAETLLDNFDDNIVVLDTFKNIETDSITTNLNLLPTIYDPEGTPIQQSVPNQVINKESKDTVRTELESSTINESEDIAENPDNAEINTTLDSEPLNNNEFVKVTTSNVPFSDIDKEPLLSEYTDSIVDYEAIEKESSGKNLHQFATEVNETNVDCEEGLSETINAEESLSDATYFPEIETNKPETNEKETNFSIFHGLLESTTTAHFKTSNNPFDMTTEEQSTTLLQEQDNESNIDYSYPSENFTTISSFSTEKVDSATNGLVTKTTIKDSYNKETYIMKIPKKNRLGKAAQSKLSWPNAALSPDDGKKIDHFEGVNSIMLKHNENLGPIEIFIIAKIINNHANFSVAIKTKENVTRYIPPEAHVYENEDMVNITWKVSETYNNSLAFYMVEAEDIYLINKLQYNYVNENNVLVTNTKEDITITPISHKNSMSKNRTIELDDGTLILISNVDFLRKFEETTESEIDARAAAVKARRIWHIEVSLMCIAVVISLSLILLFVVKKVKGREVFNVQSSRC